MVETQIVAAASATRGARGDAAVRGTSSWTGTGRRRTGTRYIAGNQTISQPTSSR
jgi:hypothetical protein